jgi:hypothetical protein
MKYLIILLLMCSTLFAAQSPAPCVFWTLGPNDVPFTYDPNLCERQTIDWYEQYAGFRVSGTLGICTNDNVPAPVQLLAPSTGMTFDGWDWKWEIPSDTAPGVYYVRFTSIATEASGATVLVKVRPDYRPIFGPLENKHQTGKKIHYFRELADSWLNLQGEEL